MGFRVIKKHVNCEENRAWKYSNEILYPTPVHVITCVLERTFKKRRTYVTRAMINPEKLCVFT